MSIRELIEQGLPTDELEVRLRELFKTEKTLIAKIDKVVENELAEKREILRELLVDTYVCDLILASHMHEARF